MGDKSILPEDPGLSLTREESPVEDLAHVESSEQESDSELDREGSM